jgi:hypothetical protein
VNSGHCQGRKGEGERTMKDALLFVVFFANRYLLSGLQLAL